MLPTDSAFRALEQRDATDEPSSEEILAAVNKFHELGAHPGAICFGGGHAEPLSANFEQTIDAMRQIRLKWHGTPIVVQTNGLFSENLEALCELHREWRSAPGSDGDSKLSVWVNLAASNPNEYVKFLKPNTLGTRPSRVLELDKLGPSIKTASLNRLGVLSSLHVKDGKFKSLGHGFKTP